jgi:hypothetical protein
VVLSLLLIAILASTIIRAVEDADAREYRITIPLGTGLLIEAGDDPDIIPNRIELVLGKQDILVIQNQDTVGHRVSDFWIGAGEILRQEFSSPAAYQGQCTIHKDAQIQIVVIEG